MSQIKGKQIKVLGTLQTTFVKQFHKNNHFFEILEFYLLYLFTLLVLINDVVGNKRYYPFLKKGKAKVNLLKISKMSVKQESTGVWEARFCKWKYYNF